MTVRSILAYTKASITIFVFTGRVSQLLKLPKPERTINQLQKRSNTACVWCSHKRNRTPPTRDTECTEAIPQYEFRGHNDAFLPKLEGSSQVLLEVTHDHEHSASYDNRSEASILVVEIVPDIFQNKSAHGKDSITVVAQEHISL